MEIKETKQKSLTGVLLGIYLIVLSWIILFKMQFDISLLKNMNFRSINLIPFAGSLIVNGKADVSEILLNIIVFVPFGVYLAMLKQKGNLIRKVLLIFGVSLLYEVLQFIFAIGGSDITDLLGNTLGGIIGIGLFAVLHRLLGEKTVRILNILATVGTIGIILFLGLLMIANV